jgi:nicotinamidase-related amidase
MPVTALDPKTALVVIDLQKGILAFAGPEAAAPVVRAAAVLCDAFRRHKLPVVLVNVTGGAPGRTEQPRRTGNPAPDWAELLPELKQQTDDITVTKKTWGAFASTDIGGELKKRGVTQIVLCGIATSIGVESTARQAYEAGLNVTLAVDAMTDMNPDAHENSIRRIFPRLGETGTTAEIVAALDAKQA